MKDLHVMQKSSLYQDITAGERLPRSKPFSFHGRRRTLTYYLDDGIYPHYAFFMSSYGRAVMDKQKTFNALQEALHKDVE